MWTSSWQDCSKLANFCGTFTPCSREFPVLSFLSAPWASDQPSRTKKSSPCWREIPAQMTTLQLYFAPWNAHRQISWTFHIQILYIKIYITHSTKIIYTVYSIYRRQSFHRSYRNTAHEIRHPSIWQHYLLFNASLPHVQAYQIT